MSNSKDRLFAKPLRLLFYDIENTPIRVGGFVWDLKLRQQYLPHRMVERDKFVICWSAKWSDQTKILSAGVTSAEAKVGDDSRVVTKLSQLMKQADYVVAHNGDRFDMPTINSRLLLQGLEPLGGIQSIDTLKIARQSFRLASNTLDYLSTQLGYAGKLSVSQDVFERCYYGDTAAIREMRAYNEHDSVLLEHVFHALKPYAKKLPRLADAAEWRQEICPYCGHDKRSLEKIPYRTGASTFKKYRCKNCRRTYRGYEAMGNRKLAANPI